MTALSDTRRNRRRLLALALAAAPGIAALAASAASAQGRYPDRPITLVVPFAPGGIADVSARAVAESLAKNLGQPVVVDNKPSAGSIVASQAVASARPDGHTLLLMSNGNAVSVGLFRKLPYDTVADLQPISTLGTFDLGIFVAAGSRFATLADLLRHAKTHPGRLNVGTIAAGSTQHLAAKLFESVAGVDMLTVPYKGSPAVLVALRSGEIDVAVEILGPMIPQVRAGDVRLLAVTGDRPNPALPSVPTVQQAGLDGYSVSSWNALAAPAGTPAPVIERLNAALQDALTSPALRSRLEPLGVRVQPSTPAQAQALLASEIKRWGDVIRAAKIQPG